MRSVTPLPPALSGSIIQRLIEIDEALIPYVSGALAWLCDKEPFEETGALTVEDAKLLFSDMLQIYFEDARMLVPVGATMTWHTVTPPLGWLICNGGTALKAQWPELFALWGVKYGGDTTHFTLPNFTDNSPMGAAGTLVALDAYAGAPTHTLTTPQIPSHSHAVTDPNHSHAIALRGSLGAGNVARSGSNDGTSANFNTNAQATGISIQNTGGGGAHNNLSPVFGVYWIVYAGKEV